MKAEKDLPVWRGPKAIWQGQHRNNVVAGRGENDGMVIGRQIMIRGLGDEGVCVCQERLPEQKWW